MPVRFRLASADVGRLRKSPLPSKYPLPPLVAALQLAVGLNGEKATTLVSPFLVMVKLLVLLSMKRLDWQVRRLVPEIAVIGAVTGASGGGGGV